MPILILLALAALAGVFIMKKKQLSPDLAISTDPFSGTLPASLGIERDAFVKTTPYEQLFKEAGAENELEWELLSAHAFVESSYNPKAKNPEGSSGLMQIFLPLSRNKGARQHVADGVLPEWENIDLSMIFDPAYNIGLGAALIRENMREFGFPRCVAVYNNSKDQSSPQNGPFISQGYVNKVLKQYNKLKGYTP